MAKDGQAFYRCLRKAQLFAEDLSRDQLEVLRVSFAFLEQTPWDSYSLRLLSHFLFHCRQFKIATVSRLVGVSRPSSSKQHKWSSKPVVQPATTTCVVLPTTSCCPVAPDRSPNSCSNTRRPHATV